MMIDLAETTTDRIHEAIRQARQRLGGPASGMVLTLVIVTDEAAQYDAVRAASEAAREHPMRVLAVITRRPQAASRLDAEIRVGESGPGEVVLLRMYGALGEHADSVVTPLLMPDTPVVTWWPGQPPEVPSGNPLGALAQRRITDAAAAEEPDECLAMLAAHYKPGDTDLSWTRATPWRTLLAAIMDQPHGTVSGGRVEAEADNPSAELIASWLSVRLGVPFENKVSEGPGVTAVVFDTSEGEISVTRPDGRVALLRRPDQPERKVALHRRDAAELLAEELRRLDPDDVYGETIAPFVHNGAAPVAGGSLDGSGAAP
jgi:glucose-6-phosphate dehydrogenase assembly protein OpcA